MFALDISLGYGESVGRPSFEIFFFLVKSEVEFLVGLATGDWVGGEDGETASRGVLRRVAPILVFFQILGFLVYIGGCGDLGHLAPFVLNLTVALRGGLRPRVVDFAFVHVDLGAVHFAAVDLRVLQRHYLSVQVAVGPRLGFGGGLCCVQQICLGFGRLNVADFEILGGDRLRRVLVNPTVFLKQGRLLNQACEFRAVPTARVQASRR